MGNAALGQPATEDTFNRSHPNPRSASELAGNAVAEKGVNVSVVRLPQVHNPVKQGLITPLIQMAREKRVSAYVADGRNRWPAGHVLDVARLYKLAIEKQQPGSRYHAVAEEGIPVRDIAEVIGRGLKVPVVSLSPAEAAAHFGWAWCVRRSRSSCFERANTGTAGMAPDRPWDDCRSGTDALFLSLNLARHRPAALLIRTGRAARQQANSKSFKSPAASPATTP